MKRFVYLVQGQASLVKNYFHLRERDKSDAIFLTYDEPIAEAVFAPDASWAQGRNKLLGMASRKGNYIYYVFCDDDIAFNKGGWDEFESSLLAHKPAVAVPIFPRTEKTSLARFGFKYQSFLINDEQMMAFHRQVVEDGIVLPYQEQFDDVHWWTACQIQEILIQSFYPLSSVQFNEIHISNERRMRYADKVLSNEEFMRVAREWVSKQFIKGFNDISCSKGRKLPVILSRTFLFSLCKAFGISDHSVSANRIKKMLSSESEILDQYMEH